MKTPKDIFLDKMRESLKEEISNNGVILLLSAAKITDEAMNEFIGIVLKHYYRCRYKQVER